MENLNMSQEDRFRRLIEKMPEYCIFYAHDANGVYKYINPGGTKLCGYTIEEFSFHYTDIYTKNPINQKAIEHTNLSLKGIVQPPYEVELYHKNGSILRLETLEFPVFDKEGNVIAVEGIARDITEQKRMEEELVRAKEEAEKANNEMSAFLATMTHELRTPLNAVVNLVDLASHNSKDLQVKKYLEMVRETSAHLIKIINNVLDFSRIESNQLTLEKIDFNIREEIQLILDLFSMQFQEKRIQIKTNFEKDVPEYIQGDSIRLKQILINIINNAIKFSDKGTIYIDVAVYEKKSEDLTLIFSIKDEGIGIEKEKQKDIFNSFYQADSSFARKYGGTGLGLSICRHLLEMMGGEIWVESDPGKGSIFRFTLITGIGNKENILSVEPGNTEHFYSIEQSNIKILLVDDNAINIKVAESFLGNLGYTVNTAQNGKEALSKLAAGKYDIVLMDIEMPEQDGIETTRKIRSGLYGTLNKKIPVIALSAHGTEEIKIKCEEAGINGHLIKPINFRNVNLLIRKMCKMKNDFSPESNEKLPEESVMESLKNEAVENIRTQSLKLQDAFLSGDRSVMKEILHDIKGVALYFDYDDIKDITSKMYNDITEMKKEQIIEFLDRINKEINKII